LVVLLFGGLPRCRQRPQFRVPFCLQDIGYQPVVGIDAQIAPLRQIRFILRAFHLELPQARRLGGPGDHLVLDCEGRGDGFGGHHLHKNIGNRRVEIAPRDPLTGWGPTGNPCALTQIVGDDPLPAALMIAHSHPLPAVAAQH
jgi:hypothetical protein